MVSKARTGASRAPGIDAGQGKGAQCRGPGLGLLVAHGKRGSGAGGVNGMKMNGYTSPPPPFYKSVGQLKGLQKPKPPMSNFATLARFLPKLVSICIKI